jgi:DNA-binding NtrC family response regulator
MPKLGGVAAAAKLAERYPQMQILFTSGYSEADCEGLPTAGTGTDRRYLPKPHSATMLSHIVREMLNQRFALAKNKGSRTKGLLPAGARQPRMCARHDLYLQAVDTRHSCTQQISHRLDQPLHLRQQCGPLPSALAFLPAKGRRVFVG